MGKLWTTCCFLLCACFAFAQEAPSDTVDKGHVTFRIHPARFLYGLHGGMDVRIGSNTLIGFTYQNYNRDFISPIRTLELDLRAGNGNFWALQLYFETRNVVYHGPRIAVKEISFEQSTYGDADDSEGTYTLSRDQLNWYLSYSAGYRRINKGFFVQGGVTAGFVWFQATDIYQLDTDTSPRVVSANQIYPHVLFELAIGWTL